MGTAQSSLERLICPRGSNSSADREEETSASSSSRNYYNTAASSGRNQTASTVVPPGTTTTTTTNHVDPTVAGGHHHDDDSSLLDLPLPELLGLPLGQEQRCVGKQHPDLLRRLAREVAFYEASLQSKDPRRKKKKSTSLGEGGVVQEWRLLYSTEYQGRSYPRLIRRITNAGPTLVLIKQQPRRKKVNDESGSGAEGEGEGEGLIIGGISFNQWKTVSERQGERQIPMATAAGGSSSSRTMAKQDPRFFGDEECFVFRHDEAASARKKSRSTQELEQHQQGPTPTTTILRGRNNINRNFMYLCDEHPTEPDRVGFGMGGQVGYHAWYIDESLETCQCKSRRCTTFIDHRSESGGKPEALHPTEEVFSIAVLEVYALDSTMLPPELRRELERKALVKRYANDLAGVDAGDDEELEDDGAGGKKKKKDKSILEKMSGADKALLELAGAHHFYSDDIRQDECAGFIQAAAVAKEKSSSATQ